MFVGIDPSQRHTGIVVLNSFGRVEGFDEIRTGDLDILQSGYYIRKELAPWLERYKEATFCVEKMMPSARCGALLFHIQMVVLSGLYECTTKKLVHPLPVQLRSYMKLLLGTVPKNGTEVVAGFQKLTGIGTRVSHNVADAYFLARMATAVEMGTWKYAQSPKELKLIPWEVMYGGTKSNHGAP